MKTIGQVIDKIDEVVATYTENALNPDRSPELRGHEIYIRREFLLLRKFITSEGTNP